MKFPDGFAERVVATARRQDRRARQLKGAAVVLGLMLVSAGAGRMWLGRTPAVLASAVAPETRGPLAEGADPEDDAWSAPADTPREGHGWKGLGDERPVLF
jgi:hypothetical protein